MTGILIFLSGLVLKPTRILRAAYLFPYAFEYLIVAKFSLYKILHPN